MHGDPDTPVDMAGLGENLAEFAGAGVVTVLSLAAVGLAVPRLFVRVLNDGIADPRHHHDPGCHTRHHYRWSCEPPCYGCRK